MVLDIDDLKKTTPDGFRARLNFMGEPESPYTASGEPVVVVEFSMPVSDARRLAPYLFEWVEFSVTNERLGGPVVKKRKTGGPSDDDR